METQLCVAETLVGDDDDAEHDGYNDDVCNGHQVNCVGMPPTLPHLLVFHVGMETEEMNALVDLNTFGLAEMSKHRKAELDILTSTVFQKLLSDRRFELITYRELIRHMGLSSMKRPPENDY